jgi:hypothetical protein
VGSIEGNNKLTAIYKIQSKLKKINQGFQNIFKTAFYMGHHHPKLWD